MSKDAPVTVELLQKYDRPGPRYTSYPTAVEFAEDFDDAAYRKHLAKANESADQPLSLYVHLPFCEERCSFCGCNVVVTKKRHVAAGYLEFLHREIDMLAASLPDRRRVSQYHWGGGTPTYLSLPEIEALHAKVAQHFTIEDDAEVAIEVDPRVTTLEQLKLLRELGFNRLSMGVQDFAPDVQEAVNRIQPYEMTRKLFQAGRDLGFHSINIDLIYGLPLQTPEKFGRSIDEVLTLRPDRVAVYSYAFVPWIKANQKRILPEQLPPAEVKLELFCVARNKFLDAGYDAIGMDHFAVPEDEMAVAARDRTLHRNFMGYTLKMGSDMVGVGTSAIGDVAGAFAQNEKKLSKYYEALDAGRFPIERGYVLDADDTIRREVIARMMCHFHVPKAAIEAAHGIVFDDYFARELGELAAEDGPRDHGFVELHDDGIDIVGNGRLFVRNVAMLFDRHLREKQGGDRPVFSRTV
jgi:oxygen-independent coproporphyrinogen-3 oxidase